ncbi:hypothetical protein BKA93DRAFT_428387 [Sparassis latifolia]|uniref:Fungal-type protein kinase domain-containing protein n=1 Tax=Sparassis crispa TaxID=139825 RepID=A0A401GQT5_9APHY|nr:predicted protein [Sparassis crispa]GBE84586.1 predicted protein [Sparassis crispa]
MATPSPPSSQEFLPEPVTPHRSSRNVVVAATPTTRDETGAQQWGFESKLANDRYERYSQEAEEFTVGPMPIEDFLNFLPEAPTKRPSARNAFSDVPECADKEKDIYTPLIAALNAERNGRKRCPGFVFLDTSSRGTNHGKPGSVKPDVVCYSTEIVDSVETNKTTHEPIGDLSFADLYIEVKGRPEQDYFTDPPPNSDPAAHKFVLNIASERKLDRAKHDLGQNIAYAVDAFARQFRTSYFSVSLSGTLARLIRWDRGGIMVSESFDLHKKPQALCEFLWRYAHASGAERGYDCTVEHATEEEEALFEKCITGHVQLQLDLEDIGQLVGKEKKAAEKKLAAGVEEHFQPGTVAAVTTFDENSNKHRVLVSRPIVWPLSLASRATREYWAVAADGDCGKVVYLKDTWRYTGDGLLKEGDVLADLLGGGVPHIPQLVHHGDVPQCPDSNDMDVDDERGEQTGFQRTLTPRFETANWACKNGQAKLRTYPQVHYRLVLGTVGYGLHKFRGTKELLSGTYDAYQAVIGAYYMDDETKRRLHRDVSMGSIILAKDSTGQIRQGYLIHWELSCLVNNKGRPRDYRRTGAFQFISQRTLTPGVAHTIQDDMESMLWVVLYCSILWLGHNRSPRSVLLTLESLFDQHLSDEDGSISGGAGKLVNQHDQRYTDRIRFSNPTIQRWLDTVMKFNSSYLNAQQHNVESAMVWEDPKAFDKFWKDFIANNDLAEDDRVDRPLPPNQVPRNGQPNPPPLPATRTMTALFRDVTLKSLITPGMKRKAEGDPVGAERQGSKRGCVSGPSGPMTRAKGRAEAQSMRTELQVVKGSSFPAFRGPVAQARASKKAGNSRQRRADK